MDANCQGGVDEYDERLVAATLKRSGLDVSQELLEMTESEARMTADSYWDECTKCTQVQRV